MLYAWGDTASCVQVVAIRKFKSMTAQGQSPSKVIIFRHSFQAWHLLPIIHQESKQLKFLGNCQRSRLGMSQELHQEVCVRVHRSNPHMQRIILRKKTSLGFVYISNILIFKSIYNYQYQISHRSTNQAIFYAVFPIFPGTLNSPFFLCCKRA